jgi:hypothetical protein
MNKERLEDLAELLNEAYNAEDTLDGCFYQPAWEDIPEVVKAYDKVLMDLNVLMTEIAFVQKLHNSDLSEGFKI